MLKELTCTLLALVWCSQIPCMAGEGLGKELLNEAVKTGKGAADKSLERASEKLTGKAANAAAKSGTTANTTAATAAKAANSPKSLTKETKSTFKSDVKKAGQSYLKSKEQQLDKLITTPDTGK